MNKSLVEMAAEIIKAQCASANMSVDEVGVALQKTFYVLQNLQSNECAAEENTGEALNAESKAVDIVPEKSILKNKIICLECGESFKQLSPKHLAGHSLTGREYRKKYGFPMRQPLCAKSLSEKRKKAGKDRGAPENLLKSIAERKKKATAKKSTAAKTK